MNGFLFQEQVVEPAPGAGGPDTIGRGVPVVGDAVPMPPVTPPAPATAPAIPNGSGRSAPSAPATAPASPEPVQLTRDMMIQMAGEDGVPKSASLGDMADLYRKITPDKLAQFEQVQKAMAGDPEATRSLMESHLPRQEPATPEAETMAALQKTVEDLKAQIDGRLSPGLQGIQNQNELGRLSEYLQASAASFPFLSKHPQGAGMVHGQLQQLQEQIRTQYNTEFASLPQPTQLQLLQGAFTACETNLKTTVELYHPSATPAAPGSQIHPVNDQVAGAGPPPSTGRWPLDPRTGMPMVPKLAVPGQPPVVQPGPPGPPGPLPSVPVTPLPTGQPAGLADAPVAQGPFTVEGLSQKIAARTRQAV